MEGEIVTETQTERPVLTKEGEMWFGEYGPASLVKQITVGETHEINNTLTSSTGRIFFVKDSLEKGIFKKITIDENTQEIIDEINDDLEAINASNHIVAEKMGRMMILYNTCRYETGYSFAAEEVGILVSEAQIKMEKPAGEMEIETIGEQNLRVDKSKFSQALAELFTNSKEAEATKVEVEVKEEGEETVMQIVDNGKGLSLHEGKKIFGLDSSTKENRHRLSSYGLFIAKTVVPVGEV